MRAGRFPTPASWVNSLYIQYVVPIVSSLFTWQLVDMSGQSIQLFRKSWGGGRMWGERCPRFRAATACGHVTAVTSRRRRCRDLALPHTSHAPHSDADEHWYAAAADTTVVSYSACWLSPLPPCTILHFIHGAYKPVLLMAFVGFF